VGRVLLGIMAGMESVKDPFVLALDVGSSSMRAAVFDSAGKSITPITRIGVTLNTDSGGATLDADALCDAALRLIRETVHGFDASIHTMMMATLVSTLVGVGADGMPTTPLYTWADSRGGEYADEYIGAFGTDAEAYRDRTGCHIHTSYWTVRLLWLRDHEAQAVSRTAYWMSFGEYLYYRVFGVRRVSTSTAAWTGLLNRHTGTWDRITLDALGVAPEMLSEISDEPFTDSQIIPGARWFPSIGDGYAANVGMAEPGMVAGTVALSLGTSGAMRVLVDGHPEHVPHGLFCYRVNARQSLIGGALSNVGNLIAWLSDTLHIELDSMDERTVHIVPESHGLVILPHFAGERAPHWNPRARAVFYGLTLDTTPEELIVAAMESIAYGFAEIKTRLDPFIPKDAAFVVSGGAASARLLQTLSDAMGVPLHCIDSGETTLNGTAYLALGIAGHQMTGHQITGHSITGHPITGHREIAGRVFHPNADFGAIYRAGAQRHRILYQRLFGE
jgi:gluconokinase